MVITGHPEAVPERAVAVGLAVSVGILEAGQFRALHHEQRALAVGQEPQRLMKAFGELLPGAIGLADEDFAAVEGHGQTAVVEESETAHLVI